MFSQEINEVQDKGYIGGRYFGDFVILDSEHSTVTYTSISNDYDEPSDVGSLRVVVCGYDGLPMHPPSPDYVPGPEYPPSSVYVPYVPEPAYPEFMLPEDDVFLAEEKPLPAAVSPTADSPANYLTDRDDEEEKESSRDNADDEEEDDTHEALRPQPPIAASTEALIAAAAVTLPLPSPPPLPRYRAAMIQLRADSSSTSHPLPLPPPIELPRTRASMVTMRAVAPFTYILAPQSGILPSGTPPSGTPPSGTPPLLPIQLPTSSPPLLLPSTDCRADVPEVTLPPRKRLCIDLGPIYEIGECSSTPTARPTEGFRADCSFVGTLDVKIRRDPNREIGYGITNVWEDPDEITEEIPATDVAEFAKLMESEARASHEAWCSLWMLVIRNVLRNRRSHARTARLIESEARASREAWVQSMDASDTTCSEAQLTKALTLLRTLQTQMVALQSQQQSARDPAHPDVPEEDSSSS
nr:hypothetical protein [Tanacetum cinerariifolium]